LLKVDDLSVYYGNVLALQRVSLEIPRGRMVSIIGANGAGKSTLLKTLSGVTRSSEGKITFENQPVERLSSKAIVRKGISLVPEGRQLFTSLKVYDNLLLGAYLQYNRRSRAEIESRLMGVFTLFPQLKERANQSAGTLSGGEQQMVSIGRALMAKPRLLMLDEPSMGLAPLVIKEIFRTIGDLNQQGVTILLVEQNARAALAICSYAYVLETGNVVRQGPGSELMHDPGIIEDYLGGS
jgi:branched-chain amino acid transport system ATP-binding protein